MRKHYWVKIVYKSENLFFLWFDDDQDGFVCLNQNPVIFTSVDAAKMFSTNQNILIEEETVLYDLSNVIDLIDKVDVSKNCGELICRIPIFSSSSIR